MRGQFFMYLFAAAFFQDTILISIHQFFQFIYTFLQFHADIGISDADTILCILQCHCGGVDILFFRHGNICGYEGFMGNQHDTMGVINQCVTRNACFFLICFGILLNVFFRYQHHN